MRTIMHCISGILLALVGPVFSSHSSNDHTAWSREYKQSVNSNEKLIDLMKRSKPSMRLLAKLLSEREKRLKSGLNGQADRRPVHSPGDDLPARTDIFTIPSVQSVRQYPDPVVRRKSSAVDSVQTLWERSYSSGLFSPSDILVGSTRDAAGDIYVAGITQSGLDGNSIYAIKYSPTGEVLWSARFKKEASTDYFATSVAVDKNGDLYVAGSVYPWLLNSRTLLIKYNANGVEQWVREYSAPDSIMNWAATVTLDSEGSPIIAGLVGGYFFDGLMLKYSSDGEPLWSVRYDGPAHAEDLFSDLVTDVANNVYVSGSTRNSSGDYDILTMKYDSVGNRVWLNQFQGPNGYDMQIGMAMDNWEYVYVAGVSTAINYSTGFVVLKYDASGVKDTIRYEPGEEYAYLNGLAVDVHQHVYLCGVASSATSSGNYITLKFSQSGALLWDLRFNSAGKQYDVATGVTVDPLENVYVVGKTFDSSSNGTYSTIRYDSAGTLSWAQNYSVTTDESAEIIFINNNGSLVVGGTIVGAERSNNSAVFSYDFSGNILWEQSYDGPKFSHDDVRATTTDEAHNIYLAVRSGTSDPNVDWAIMKYSSSGEQRWISRFDEDEVDDPFAIAVDRMGNVYVTGQSDSYMTTVKYDSSGNELWIRRFYESFNGIGIAVDADGNSCVIGDIVDAFHNYRIATIRYSASGQTLWTNIVPGDSGTNSYANSIVIDRDGNIVVGGLRDTSNHLNSEYIIVKYHPDGNEEWTTTYAAEGYYHNYMSALITDRAKNFYATGVSVQPTSVGDILTVKIGPDGVVQWSKIFNGISNLSDRANGIAVDDENSVILTGWSETVYGHGPPITDFLTLKYDSSGTEKWVEYFHEPGWVHNTGTSIATDHDNNILVTGYSHHVEDYSGDYLTFKYSPQGEEIWKFAYGSPEHYLDQATSIITDESGSFYLIGITYNDKWYRRVTIAKYGQISVGVTEHVTGLPAEYRLLQNYPNPFNPSTVIRYEIPTASRVKLTIYTMLGQEVKTLVDEVQDPGYKRVEWNATAVSSGIYFYKLTAGSFTEVKKLVPVK